MDNEHNDEEKDCNCAGCHAVNKLLNIISSVLLSICMVLLFCVLPAMALVKFLEWLHAS